MKRGQFQISFGVIFSIIIVIFTLAIAFYVISYFLNTQKCTNLGLFYKDIEERVDKAWYSPATSESFKGSVPSSVDFVCFGNLSQSYNPAYKTQYEELKKYRNYPVNVFTYPIEAGCGSVPGFYNLKHARMNEFFCAPAKSGKISVNIKKDVSDALVLVSQ